MTKSEALMSAPPVTVAGATFLGYSLPEWAAIVTIIYTVLLAVRLVRNEWKAWRDDSEAAR
jgi:disulfide bond formation protein DsbB